MTNFNKYVLESPDQNVSAGDVNLTNALALQNFKNFNTYILSQLDCVIAGLQIVAPINPLTGSVTVKAGYALYSTPNATTTVPSSNPSATLSYKGSVIEISTDLIISIPTPNISLDRIDAIDLIYTEISGVPSSRNFINPGTGAVAPQTTNTQMLGNSVQNPGSPNTNILYTNGTPGASPAPPAIPANSIRLALILVTHGGSFNITQNKITQSGSTGTSGISGTLPRLFEMQNFPSNASNPLVTPGVNQPDQSISIADSLSSLRYQINKIITGGSGNWYSAVPISLPQLLIWGGVDTGSVNNYNISIANFPAALSPGMRVFFKAIHTNTGASALVTNGGGSIAIKDSVGNDIPASSIQNGQRVLLFYDGTFWIMPYLDVGLVTVDGSDIPNGSYEFWNGSIPKQWSVVKTLNNAATTSQDTTNNIDGQSALNINTGSVSGLGGGATVTSTMIPISPKNTYYIKFKTFSDYATLGGFVSVSFYDGSGTFISSSNIWVPIGGAFPAVWTTYYGIVQSNTNTLIPPTNVLAPFIPASARFMSVNVNGGTNGGPANKNAWFDGVHLFVPASKGTYQIFPASASPYTFVTTSNCISIDGDFVSGGGGGGGDNFGNPGGGGGGSGAFNRLRISVIPDTTYTVLSGAGGGGAGHDASGGSGGSSGFGTYLVTGGSGGGGGNSGGVGGAAGTPLGILPTVVAGALVLAFVNGNAGSSHGLGATPGNGGTLTLPLGVLPFAGGSGGGGSVAGGLYGGGGGGNPGGSGGNSGSGGNGIVIIYY
jgi:hypothetical protein